MTPATPKSINELLWLVAEWEAAHEGYETDGRLQAAIRVAILPRDLPALLKANSEPFATMPMKLPDWIRLDAGAA
jgi:hypothetical protein